MAGARPATLIRVETHLTGRLNSRPPPRRPRLPLTQLRILLISSGPYAGVFFLRRRKAVQGLGGVWTRLNEARGWVQQREVAQAVQKSRAWLQYQAMACAREIGALNVIFTDPVDFSYPSQLHSKCQKCLVPL